MKVRYLIENGKTEIHLSDVSDWKLFDRIADLIESELKCQWVEKADGLDQRYWDFIIEESKLTLHLEHYLGICIFPAIGNENLVEANQMVRKIGEYFEAHSD